MNQLDMFEEPACDGCGHDLSFHFDGLCQHRMCPCESLPYQAHSETSREAAIMAAPNAKTLRAEVLKLLRQGGPMTDEAIQRTLRMDPNTQRPRRVELVKGGFVKDSGLKGTTSSGRKAVLWEAI